MGERLLHAPLSVRQSRRSTNRCSTRLGRRFASGFSALVFAAVFVGGSADVALSQGGPDDQSESVADSETTEQEELPPLEIEWPEDVDDLDLGPAAPPPPTLPSGDLSNVRLADLIPNPELIHPDLPGGIVVNPSSLGPIANDLNQARSDLVDAKTRMIDAQTQFNLASLRMASIDEELDAAINVRQATAIERVEATDDLRGFAVGTFIGSEELGSLALSNDLDSLSLTTLAEEAELTLSATMLEAVGEAEAANVVLAELRQERFVQQATRSAATQTEETAVIDIADAEGRIETLGPQLETSILELEVSGTDMPLVVLDAYYRAAENFRVDRPSCRVSWHQLAGIGRVESGHGTFGGSVVGRDGRTSNEILGPVLDGDPWLAIPDTDGGQYDLDTVWDRAVGPMQFIPGSWARFGQDGNGDGIVDPHNLYDAAMAAAGHLCGSAGNLDQQANYQRALLGYNRSAAYGLLVMGYADEYFEALDLAPNL